MMTSVTKTTSTQLVLKRSLDATSLEIAADGVSQEDSTLAGGSLSYALMEAVITNHLFVDP